jgi:NTE family protein
MAGTVKKHYDKNRTMKQKIKWALVLSGGGARGIAHIGVLKELEAAGFPKPSLVVGTSMGAIVGGLYACGMSPGELARFVVEEFDINKYLDSFVFRINGPVGKVMQTGQALASLAIKPGIDSGHRILELLENLTGGKTFGETEIPFRCNAVDLSSGREVIFDSGSVARAVRASMSFPVFFEPLMENGMCLVDGGILNNMPVTIARNEGFRRILAVNVNRFLYEKAEDLKNGPQIIYRSIESVLRAQDTDKKVQAGLTLNATDDATPFSFFRQKELIELGEYVVKKNIEAVETFFNSGYGFFKQPVVCGPEGTI